MMSIKQALRSERRAWKRWNKARFNMATSSVLFLKATKAANRRKDVRERYTIEGKKGWM